MSKIPLFTRRKVLYIMLALQVSLILLGVRVLFIQAFQGEDLQAKAFEQQTRDREIRAERGTIFDRNGVALAVSESAASVSVLYAQMTDRDLVADILAQELELDRAEV